MARGQVRAATARKPAAKPEPPAPQGHGLAEDETIIGRRDNIVVTSAGRKVIVNRDGSVRERLVGPRYDWEG